MIVSPMSKEKKGMVFGVFDGLHEGHVFFLESAAAQSEKLIVVVAEDGASSALKGRAPKHALKERMLRIESLGKGWTVLAGDSAQGEWSALKKYAPDRVFLGHDQHRIAEELQRMGIPFSFIGAHSPERYKSSLLP